MDKHFGGIIWTNHALQRMRDRGIKQGDAWACWRRPDNSRASKNKGTWVYYRNIGNQQVEVVAKKNERGEWIVLSVWSRTKISGSNGKPKSNAFIRLIKIVFGKK